MKIVPVNEYRVEVTLSPEELREFDITYEQLDYADADTRRVLWTLLAEVRRMNGVALDVSGKLLIEVTRETDGSCRVCFTSLPQKEGQSASVKQLVKTEAEPVVLECADLDSAVRAAAAGKTDAPCGLYVNNGCYRLLYRTDSDERDRLALQIAEFGELLTPPTVAAAACAEHWRCLAPDDAAALLRKLR